MDLSFIACLYRDWFEFDEAMRDVEYAAAEPLYDHSNILTRFTSECRFWCVRNTSTAGFWARKARVIASSHSHSLAPIYLQMTT